MRVVSDTSPLSCLASLDRLDLIERQFRGSVIVPHAVEQELLRHPDPRALERLQSAFAEGTLRVQELEPTSLTRILGNTLDAGEVQAISLALAEKADRLLIDEREGRQAARSLGLPVTGTLGILMRAKQDGSLSSLRLALECLREKYGFALDPVLVARALAEFGESEPT